MKAVTKLIVTFEGPRVGEDGVPLEDLQAALGHAQRAFRHMVAHLRGGEDRLGPPAEPMRRVGLLSRGAPSAESVEAELVLSAESDNGQPPADHCLAVERLLGWREDLGEDGDQFPPIVVEELAAIGSDLSPAVSTVRLADPVSGRCLELRRKEIAEPLSEVEQISGTRSCREPFDLEAFRNNPNPKIFDPDDMVTVSEPFDVDAFLRTIYEGRSVKKEWMP